MPKVQKQAISLTIHRFDSSRYWAFKQMQLGKQALDKIPGLSFYKILGTGAGNGFSIRPDFGRYAMLTVWDDDEQRRSFLSENEYYRSYAERAASSSLFSLRAIHGHGQWDGREPFVHYKDDKEKALSWAVLTRANIRFSRMAEFWRSVPGVSKTVPGSEGLMQAMGIGEWPLVQQATFSEWESLEAMKSFAYKSRMHEQVVRKTRERNWYGEEMFTRFKVLEKH